jgi:hypothetical protein
LETLIINVRNAALGYQRFITKSEKMVKLNLTNKLERLKLDYSSNAEAVVKIEKKLGIFSDFEMKSEVTKFRHYETLSHEKITPAFLKLAKSMNTDYSLSDIRDDDGSVFRSEKLRNNYIADYYANIYLTPKCDYNRGPDLVSEFLGPEIIGHPAVQNSKLTEDERTNLDLPLSLAELDAAVSQANLRSAPGLDGLNMNFIIKFWGIFRVPLLKYSNTCFAKGTLTATFRSAGVRLIPKKGDKTKIKNWRPISLLSNLFKVLSRALNNRLKLVVDRVTSRAQKGFTNSRYLQEVLINVIDCIGYVKKNNLGGAVVSIDMSKALTPSVIYFFLTVTNFSISDRFLQTCWRLLAKTGPRALC